VGACLLLLLLSAIAPAAVARSCSNDDGEFYEKGNFKVRQVRIESPLDFMHAISSQLNALKPTLPLQPGSVFNLDKSDEGRKIVSDAMKALEEEDDPRSRILVVLAGFDNCDENGAHPLLDVYYRVFTTNYNAYLSHTFEIKNDEIEQPATAAATTAANTQTKGFLKVQPFVKYNRTRQLFGGGRVRVRMPGGIFDAAEVSAGGSTAGSEQAFEMSGSRTPGRAAINELEYRISYKHSDLPASDNRLREGLMQAQFFGATSPLGSKGIVLRYGVSLEGGNQQTDLATVVDRSQADSGYGGLKSYLGATFRTKNVSMTASYGLQLGTRGATTDLDFVKHIGDVALNARWLIKPKPGVFHRAVTLEAQLTGGAIKTLGTLPVAQRFFGGNVARDFIEGDTWRIRSGPFIRSIPENRLDSSSTLGGGIGGTGFYSTNLTLALPLWGKPLVSSELTDATDSKSDLTFSDLLNGQKESARKQLVFRHLNEIPAFNGLIAGLKPVDNDLKELEPLLQGDCKEPPDGEEDTRTELELTRCMLKDLVTILRDQLKDENKEELPSRLDAILMASDASATCVEDDACSALKRLRAGLETWAGLLRPAGSTQAADTADRVRNSLATQQSPLAKTYKDIEGSDEWKKAEDQGTEDMKQIGPVIDSFIYELNWFAVSPVAVFDAARIWPDRNGTRFGIGGGVRLSVVNFNVTVGYAFNPNPKLREGRGAMFFSMDVTDLFR
jgi:hypothetical protein